MFSSFDSKTDSPNFVYILTDIRRQTGRNEKGIVIHSNLLFSFMLFYFSFIENRGFLDIYCVRLYTV